MQSKKPKNLSEIAAIMGVSRQAVSAFVRCEMDFSMESIAILVNRLGCDFSQLAIKNPEARRKALGLKEKPKA